MEAVEEAQVGVTVVETAFTLEESLDEFNQTEFRRHLSVLYATRPGPSP